MHLKHFLLSWTNFTWRSKLEDSPNDVAQIWQIWSFTFSWTFLTWIFRYSLLAKAFGQTVHENLFVNLFNMLGQIPCRDERAVANWTQMRHFQAIKLVTQSHQFVTQRLVFGPIGTLGLRVQIPPESLKQILNDGYSYPSKPVLWITCKLHKLVWQSLIQLLLLSDR